MQRRVFLRAGGLAAVGFGALPRFVLRAAEAADGARRRRVLVVVFQRGANDGLNTVVPHGERAYYDARPSIAVPRPNGGTDAALDLDGHFGLHPALAPLMPWWQSGRLGFAGANQPG